jgi:hypothetical protein
MRWSDAGIRHLGWYCDFDFRARVALAPYIQCASGALTPFAHTLQTKLSRPPATIEDLSLDTGAVIANAKRKDGFAVIDFCFDMPRSGVPAGVPECFPCNLIQVVTYQRRQSPGLTFDDDPVGGPAWAGLSEFLS